MASASRSRPVPPSPSSRPRRPFTPGKGSALYQYVFRRLMGGDYLGEIGRRRLTHLQAQSGANLGLILQAGNSGVIRGRTYLATDGATYGRRLIELAEVDNGFEWRIDIVPGSSGLERRWVWGYPILGQQTPPLYVFVDSPSGRGVLEWDENIDALRGATRGRARGGTPDTGDASTIATPLISPVHVAAAHLAAGWPRLDRTINKSSVVVQATLAWA
ncbi:hypothetical protein ACFWY5_31975 [Nonomuraea sp. NPDC059007]|uniref:hypothetical protein n=1 Tax=Nonomuraea sp. NPDC059007 TaxID=3346692 RepID=UPI00368D8C1B